jgi:hypothetical protein
MELQIIQNKIYEIRGFKVMLDFDLADIYQVETKVLNQSVKRNIERFPPDFMFQLTNQEFNNLRSQIVTSSLDNNNIASQTITNSRWGGKRYLPYAFTEHGVTMLASVLRSKTAIEMNLQVVRAFIALRQFALGYAELNVKLENFIAETNMQFSEIYQALTELAEKKKIEEKPRRPVGFGAYLTEQ